jgi:glutamate-1-semialdehyde 2,1-aminomutase
MSRREAAVGRDARLGERARRIVEQEAVRYRERTRTSEDVNARARRVMPLGVPSSFQAYDPHPIVIRSAAGSEMVDVDGNVYVDYDMGFGALFAGHVHPAVRAAVDAQLDRGTLFVTPCEGNTRVAELLAARYGLDMWRFTNSGTEATMDAIRVARAATGRDRIVKVEGGYHGHHDAAMISTKPPLARAGDPRRPTSVPSSAGITAATLAETVVVPYNDADALEAALAGNDIAAFIVEPVLENIGICLPQPGYLAAAREITRRHGTLLIFDEVKTGITAGWGGATGALGV